MTEEEKREATVTDTEEPKKPENQHCSRGNNGKQTPTHEEETEQLRRRFKVGNLEMQILYVLAEVERTDERPEMSRSRRGRIACSGWKKLGKPHVPLIWIRNSIFHTRNRSNIKASDKANFSRAVKCLEEKDLIATCNWNNYPGRKKNKVYRTHAVLTPRGAGFLLRARKKLTCKEASP